MKLKITLLISFIILSLQMTAQQNEITSIKITETDFYSNIVLDSINYNPEYFKDHSKVDSLGNTIICRVYLYTEIKK